MCIRDRWSAILTCGLWAFATSMFFLTAPVMHDWFREGPDGMYLMTGYFAFYIFMAAFNAFNARTERLNLFDNIEKNHGFWKIILLIVLVQILMTYLGGNVLRCYGLLVDEWAVVLLLAFTIVPVDLIRKVILSGVRKRD